MPMEEAPNYYPEFTQHKESMADLKADIEAGMPQEEIRNYYPELFEAPKAPV